MNRIITATQQEIGRIRKVQFVMYTVKIFYDFYMIDIEGMSFYDFVRYDIVWDDIAHGNIILSIHLCLCYSFTTQ